MADSRSLKTRPDASLINQKFIAGVNFPYGVTVDASHISWTNGGAGVGTTTGRANLDGAKVNQHFIRGAKGPCGIAIG